MAGLDERRRLDIEREDDPAHVKLLPSSIRFHEFNPLKNTKDINPNNLPHYIDYSSKNPIRDPETGMVHDSFRNPPPYPVIQQNIRLDKANPIKDGPDDKDSDGDDSEDDHDSSRIFIRPVTKVSTHTSSSRKCLKVTSKKKRWLWQLSKKVSEVNLLVIVHVFLLLFFRPRSANSLPMAPQKKQTSTTPALLPSNSSQATTIPCPHIDGGVLSGGTLSTPPRIFY